MSGPSIERLPDTAAAADVVEALRTVVYREDPHHRPGPRAALEADLARPRFETRFLAAFRDGDPVAFVAARISGALRDERGPVGTLGTFESLDRPDAARALLDAAVGWLGGRGAGTVVGPMNGDTWHSYRLTLGPRDDPPFPLEPWNPPYYPDLWDASGFAVRERYHSKRVDVPTEVARVLAPKHEGALAAGYRFEPVRADRLDADLARIHRLSELVFAENPLYSPIPEDEFLALYAGVGPLLDPASARIAVAPDGSDAGFVFGIPDGGTAVNVKSLGVHPDHRRAGLGGALTYLCYRAAVDREIPAVNLCLMHDANVSSRLDAGRSRLLRRYALWARTAGGAR